MGMSGHAKCDNISMGSQPHTIARSQLVAHYQVEGLPVQGDAFQQPFRAGQKTGDEDLLVATLNVIQNFMRISFPMLEGKRLRSISQGDLTLVTETGKHLFLTVVIAGDDSPELRAEMRGALKDFEASNRALFQHWDGKMETPRGADEALARLLALAV